MSAKTYNRQTAKFLAVVGENMPELSGDVMQKWIQNPEAVQQALRNAFCSSPEAEPVSAKSSVVVSIDRSQPFDSVELLGQGWVIDEQDERSLGLTQVNLAKVRLEHMLEKGEGRIGGEKRLKRLKEADYIRLDAKVFQALWENQKLIPKQWKQKTGGRTTYVFFDGTVLRGPDGYRCVLYLFWLGGQWYLDYRWLERDWSINNPSAVLASI